jgi:hypothetical protein
MGAVDLGRWRAINSHWPVADGAEEADLMKWSDRKGDQESYSTKAELLVNTSIH